MNEPEDVLAEIDAAFRNGGLKIRDGLPEPERKKAEAVWSSAIHTLGAIAIYGGDSGLLSRSSQPQHHEVGKEEARKELNKLARAAEALVECFGMLSKTAIESLGGSHIREPIATQCAWLRDLSEVARCAEISSAKGRARKKNQAAIRAATIVVEAFENFTGRRTDASTNDFWNDRPAPLEPLVRQIFEIVGIKADAKHYLDLATIAPRQAHTKQAPLLFEHRTRGTFADSTELMFERMRRTELDKVSPKNWRRAF